MSPSMMAAQLEGRWQMVRAEFDGAQAPELVAQKTMLELKQGHYSVSFDGKIVDQGNFNLDADSPANQIRFEGTDGPNQGRSLPSVYQRVGERLRICYGLDGVLPESFTTATDHQRYLATYRRISSD